MRKEGNEIRKRHLRNSGKKKKRQIRNEKRSKRMRNAKKKATHTVAAQRGHSKRPNSNLKKLQM